MDYISTRKTVAKKLWFYIYCIYQLLQHDSLMRGRVASAEVLEHTIIRTNFITQLYNTTSTSMAHGSGDQYSASHYEGFGSILDECMWYLWSGWQWDRFYSANFNFPLSVSFHQHSTRCNSSITIIYALSKCR